MKLSKIKLINWHIFQNNTIDVNGNILITGENASGKSTLMDAIYFVLSGGDTTHFNKAANEGGQRSLETYIRGKLGSIKTPYIRSGSDVISYVVLEYQDIKKHHQLAVGANIEITQSTKPVVHFFVINDYSIKDDDYILDKHVLDYKTFKSKAKAMSYDFSELPTTKRELRRTIAKEIFKLDDYKRYYDLLQNAICFKPISEVSTFVNSFLLEEDNIELNTLKEEIRSYQSIHKLVLKEKEKIEVLKDFVPKAEKYVNNNQELKYLNTLKVDYNIERLNNQLNRTKIELNRLNELKDKNELEKQDLSENQRRLQIEMHQLESSEEYKALLNKKEILEKYKKELDVIKCKLNDFEKSINEEDLISKKLELNYRFSNDIKEKDFAKLKAHLENYNDELNILDNELRNNKIIITNNINNNKTKIKENNNDLTNLKRGINNYPKDVLNLIEVIKEEIIKSNPKEKNPFVTPLCELIEIKDEAWSSAIEGYLNTQRFNIIVEPKYYDIAALAFNKYKDIRNIYTSGIVNVDKIPFKKEVKNSLYSKIEVKNKYANRYISYLLADVVFVDDVLDLKKYDISITKDCMLYKNYVLKAINPKIYQIPFIGKSSKEKRVKLLEDETHNLEKETIELNNNLIKIDNKLNLVTKSNVYNLKKTPNYFLEIEIKENNINSLTLEIKEDEEQKGLLQLSSRIENTKNKLNEISNKLSNCDLEIKNIFISIGETNQKIKELETNLDEEQTNFFNSLDSIDNSLYQTKKNKYIVNNWLDIDKINNDFESCQKYNNSVFQSLLSIMQKYSSNYKASLTAIKENIEDFINEYYDLINRGVVEYENEAKEAYEKALVSFKEDFIAKLKEKIEKSEAMLDKINKNLSTHPFGIDEEKYKFHYEATKDSEFYNYYRIIMSGKLMESKDLFTELLDEKDNSYMQDLFNKISLETDSEEAEREVRRYLDYRNYMSYDIKITNKYGDETYFSKINKEKLGGETQTPFYIVIASCFDELMNKDKNKVDSTCTVVFDEAFNNMDEGRIKSLMEFYKELNIEVIIIVPSNRISAISPYMDTLVGITKVNNHPYITVLGKE